ncbi:hypothetical protein OIU76_008683 [Salix suchowensis]|nr:hypothetical protein OIU76_008683 [Salix suchowensis]
MLLQELPRDIHKLINLKHLDNAYCRNLKYMPSGIGKLTSLQTLSCFVVAKKRSPECKMVGGLDELCSLNELRGSLEIKVTGYERDSCISEFEGAKLKDKQHLQSLTITWVIDMDSDIDLYDKMLQSLRPHSNLQGLIVRDWDSSRGYWGMSFPSWLSSLSNLVKIHLDGCTRIEHIPPLDRISNLVEIHIDGCSRIEHIPPLDGIPSLEELLIQDMNNLEYIDSEGVGGKEVSKVFPSLKKLKIWNCSRLKGWWKKSRGEMKNDSDESTVEEELIMPYFPSLSSLTIYNCPYLTSMPLFPTLDECLHLNHASSMPLQQTMKMKPPVYSSFIHPLSNLKKLDIFGIDDMESHRELGLQNLSSLQQLQIMYLPRLKSLPLHAQGMPSLQKLVIRECPRLKSLSESKSPGMIPYLPSLQELEISHMEWDSRGLGKESEEVWPNIKHIPNILFHRYYVQKDGRYVEGEGLYWDST